MSPFLTGGGGEGGARRCGSLQKRSTRLDYDIGGVSLGAFSVLHDLLLETLLNYAFSSFLS